MTFDELLSCASQVAPKTIPKGAEWQLEHSVSEKTKRKLLALPMDEGVRVIIDAIEKINCGSVESIEKLIEAKLYLNYWVEPTTLLDGADREEVLVEKRTGM